MRWSKERREVGEGQTRGYEEVGGLKEEEGEEWTRGKREKEKMADRGVRYVTEDILKRNHKDSTSCHLQGGIL